MFLPGSAFLFILNAAYWAENQSKSAIYWFLPCNFPVEPSKMAENGDFQEADSVCMQEMLAVAFWGMSVQAHYRRCLR